MTKTISSIALASIMLTAFAGCGATPSAPEEETLDERCRVDDKLAPQWVCDESIEGATYASVGIGSSKMPSMRKAQAITRARAGLALQIKTTVKAKMEDFMRSTGNGDAETIDAVTTAVTKQTAKVDLAGSKVVKTYSRGNTVYLLVAVPDQTVNSKVQDSVKKSIQSSKGNDNALWQQFQSKQAMDSLDKEFPTN